MTAPILTKLWTVTPNLRRAYTSLVDALGWFFYQNKTAMLAAGWSVVFSCDGTTGPVDSSDSTDRWTSEAAVATRAAIAGAAQSYIVLQNVDGVQVLFTYQGATDDVGRISLSPGGLFVLAGTTTFQPTASDEVLFSSGNSLVNNGTSADRVMTIWCANDSRHWASIVFRAGAIINYTGVERVVSFCGAGVFNVPYVGYRYVSMAMVNGPSAGSTGYSPGGLVNSVAPSATGFLGCAARVFTAAASRIVRVGGGDIQSQGISDANFNRGLNISDRFFLSGGPALQGEYAPCFQPFWSGEKSTNLDGILGSPIDWWFCKTSSGSVPAVGNFLPGYTVGDTPDVTPLRSNWFVSLGSECIRPWMNAAPTLITF